MSESLPHNSDAEMALLCSITLKSELLDELPRDLGSEKFYIPALKFIYDAVVVVRERDKRLGLVAARLASPHMLYEMPIQIT